MKNGIAMVWVVLTGLLCATRVLAAGDYAIMRDGVNFDPYAKLRTLKQARSYARSLERFKLCTAIP